MTSDLVRYQNCGVFHFLTFSCYRRQPLLASSSGYDLFERELEAVRRRYGFVVAGYVLMPEHVHMLVGEPRENSLAVALQVLKQMTSRKLKAREQAQFWQRRYYDFNVWSDEKRIEKLRYMHRNPVVRGLVEKPEDWRFVELSPLRHRRNRHHRDRVATDRKPTRSRTKSGKPASVVPTLAIENIARMGPHLFTTVENLAVSPAPVISLREPRRPPPILRCCASTSPRRP